MKKQKTYTARNYVALFNPKVPQLKVYARLLISELNAGWDWGGNTRRLALKTEKRGLKEYFPEVLIWAIKLS